MSLSSSLFLSFFLFFSISFLDGAKGFIGTYGVNYGQLGNNLPAPESVVTLLKAAKIRNVRIYDTNPRILSAFKGSGIEIIVGLPNELLVEIGTGEDQAMSWIKLNVEPYIPGTRIRGIAVGNEILGGSGTFSEVLLPAVKNIYTALQRLGLERSIEVSSPHSEAVFSDSYPPSSCVFRPEVAVFMKPLLEFFSKTGSPFYINAYPFLAYKSDTKTIDIDYVLFRKNAGIFDPKTKLHYDNMFDAQIDASYAALRKAGFGDMEVIVSETGWASKGDQDEPGASLANARTYNLNLKKKLAKKKGTPLKPNKPVRAYVFALFNENQKPGPTSERNFGLFNPDGSISYNIGFTGLVPSHGVGLQAWLRSSSSWILTACSAVLLLVLTP